ncbi:hypothetical protein [Brevundimonas diminuta]|uniref:hypothetical protein n=1 Tax=Brevundimonas diminuta TaxID=293 RepID=UPI0030F75BA5
MFREKIMIVALAALLIGFAAGFVLRPVIVPAGEAVTGANSPSAIPAAREPRGVQYFAANLEEARQVVGQCREGTVRGGECANAETAIIEAEGKERFSRFLGN